MKIALAQINPTIGDFPGNVRKIIDYSSKAQSLGADLCLFPEQCIPGYPAQDLLERSLFIEKNLSALDDVRTSVKGIGIIVGFAEPHPIKIGKGLYNSAALLYNSEIISTHRKSLLPTYDVFDEARYFDSAPEIKTAEFRGVKFGITICEDVWNDPEFWSKRLYQSDPSRHLINQDASFIINIAASPFTYRKRQLRRDMLSAFAINHQAPLLFINAVGGNDDLVFDGASLVFDDKGKLIARGADFSEDLILIELDSSNPSQMKGDINTDIKMLTDEESILEALILGTRDYAQKCGFKKALLGLSGGMDSALVTYIGVQALGKENIEVWLMPSPYSSPGSISDSLDLVKNLDIQHRIIPIDKLLDAYLTELKPIFGNNLGVTEENIQARIRGNLLMANSNYTGRLLLTTGNKSEFATGYCTLYGDMAGGLAVLSDVPKTLVYNIARFININAEIIPNNIITKPPSAELRHDQKDTDSLPPYEILDQIVDLHVDQGYDYQAIIDKGFDPVTVKHILHLISVNEYKRRQSPPGIKVMGKSFGFGRRIPLAQRWRP